MVVVGIDFVLGGHGVVGPRLSASRDDADGARGRAAGGDPGRTAAKQARGGGPEAPAPRDEQRGLGAPRRPLDGSRRIPAYLRTLTSNFTVGRGVLSGEYEVRNVCRTLDQLRQDAQDLFDMLGMRDPGFSASVRRPRRR